MKVFYGAAIQGEENMGQRAHLHRSHMAAIKSLGHKLYTEHTGGRTRQEIVSTMKENLGPLPETTPERYLVVRDLLVKWIENEAQAAVFEVSLPSLGTGVEISHAYLRPKMGLAAIPILLLYEKNFWPNGLSTMLRGISNEVAPYLVRKEYESASHARQIIQDFFSDFVPQFVSA